MARRGVWTTENIGRWKNFCHRWKHSCNNCHRVKVEWHRIEGNANILRIEQFELQKDTQTATATRVEREKTFVHWQILSVRDFWMVGRACNTYNCVHGEGERCGSDRVCRIEPIWRDNLVCAFRFPNRSCPRNFSQSTIEFCHLPFARAHHCSVSASVCYSDHIRFRTGFIRKRKTQNEKNEKRSDCFELPLDDAVLGISTSRFHYFFLHFPPMSSFRFYSLVFHVSGSVCFNVVCKLAPFSWLLLSNANFDLAVFFFFGTFPVHLMSLRWIFSFQCKVASRHHVTRCAIFLYLTRIRLCFCLCICNSSHLSSWMCDMRFTEFK